MTHSFLMSSRSVEETRHIGRIIGEMAEAGTLIALRGNLGCGKTALVQGLARGLEVPEKVYVTSPSYTLVNEYPGRLPLFHLDLYRLTDLDFDDIGLHDLLDTHSAVVVIEWFEGLTLQMEITGDNTRNIIFTADGDQPVQLLTRIEHRLKENLWH
ncbi:MAG: tRNA (adenosine(37)-N6)-threonylcarbamoyltransferase complex ATPase subunit type 1 TsaE [Deltaproteobacteria bacterium]|nr:tRNA (adenosine(37)-N6)-threonylcarbamoyltransferase complex ATPase subunit type 1 TsaE [Deltaproteobacteria bacterium]